MKKVDFPKNSNLVCHCKSRWNTLHRGRLPHTWLCV